MAGMKCVKLVDDRTRFEILTTFCHLALRVIPQIGCSRIKDLNICTPPE